jgi:hypothetical protein
MRSLVIQNRKDLASNGYIFSTPQYFRLKRIGRGRNMMPGMHSRVIF